MDVWAGTVFCTSKDPEYSNATMPGGKSIAIVFSKGQASDVDAFVEERSGSESTATAGKSGRRVRAAEYDTAKEQIKKKMLRSPLLNFSHLELTLKDHTLRSGFAAQATTHAGYEHPSPTAP
jgi:hypothetical protein